MPDLVILSVSAAVHPGHRYPPAEATAAVVVVTVPAVAPVVDPRTAAEAMAAVAVVDPTAVEVARADLVRIAVVDPIVAAAAAASIRSVVTPAARQQPFPHEPRGHCEYAARYTEPPVLSPPQ